MVPDRLENASWRAWAKQKYNFKTVNFDKLNWYVSLLYLYWVNSFALRYLYVFTFYRLNEYDITWLYDHAWLTKHSS